MKVREVRLARLKELLVVYKTQAALSRRSKKSAPQINQWLSGNRTITEDSAREIEAAVGRPRGWMDTMETDSLANDFTPGASAPLVGSPFESPPATHRYPLTILWGDLRMGELPESFGLELPDDSMAPDAPAGALVWFERDLVPRAQDWVLLVDDAGDWHVREYKERRPGHFEAHAINKAFLPLDSIRDGLQVKAVYIGQRGRKGGA